MKVHTRALLKGLLVLAFVLVGTAAAAQSEGIRTERVRFDTGTTGTTIEGSLKGYEIVDYLLGAKAGQAMNIDMTTDSTANYFNILAPGETEVAFFIGSIEGNAYTGQLTENGDYTIRVYQMRSAARRDEVANFRLAIEIAAGDPTSADSVGDDVPAAPGDGGPRYWEVTGTLNLREQPSATSAIVGKYAAGTILNNLGCEAAGGRFWCDVQELGGGPVGYVAAEYLRPAVGPDGAVATGYDDSALRAGQGDFDATGTIPCSQFAGQPMGQCDFGVARGGGGDATVIVTRPDGSTRAIFFQMGIPIGADTSQADGYPGVQVERVSDLNMIRIGDERYEIPDAVPLGG